LSSNPDKHFVEEATKTGAQNERCAVVSKQRSYIRFGKRIFKVLGAVIVVAILSTMVMIAAALAHSSALVGHISRRVPIRRHERIVGTVSFGDDLVHATARSGFIDFGPTHPCHMLMIGQTISHYRVVEKLGR
jgi:hypothetical protein